MTHLPLYLSKVGWHPTYLYTVIIWDSGQSGPRGQSGQCGQSGPGGQSGPPGQSGPRGQSGPHGKKVNKK